VSLLVRSSSWEQDIPETIKYNAYTRIYGKLYEYSLFHKISTPNYHYSLRTPLSPNLALRDSTQGHSKFQRSASRVELVD